MTNQAWGWNFQQIGDVSDFAFSASGGWEDGALALLSLHVEQGAELKVSRHYITEPGQPARYDAASFEITGDGGAVLSAMADVAAFMESQDVTVH